jgi:hypothetical protein
VTCLATLAQASAALEPPFATLEPPFATLEPPFARCVPSFFLDIKGKIALQILGLGCLESRGGAEGASNEFLQRTACGDESSAEGGIRT